MKYEPVFKLPYSNVFITDMFVTAYSNSEPIVTIKNGKWEFFLSEAMLRKTAEKGFEFAIDPDKFKEFETKYSFFKEKLDSLEKVRIEELDKEKFISFLEDFKDLFIDFFRTYQETEFFYFTKVEDELKDYIKDKYSFEDVLSNKADIVSWPEGIRKLADYIVNMQHLKLEYRKVMNGLALGEKALLPRVLEQLGIKTEREDVASMTIEEVKMVLNDKELGDVSDRHVYSYIEWDKDNQRLRIFAGGEGYKKIRELEKDIPKNEVIGEVACRGIVKGVVKVIPLSMHPEEYLPKMEQGDILVSTTTGPELMPAIEKAAAIVTDQGGMMSHAAIISREFNTPCVVGTKYATEVFKDGDLVEVNAHNGVVRKIDAI